MKKIIVLALMVLTIAGCSLSNTPSGKVEAYLNNYIKLNDDVIMDIETTVSNENLSNENKEIYKSVLKRQYENMKYEIKDESIDGDKATVIAKITVYDLYRIEQDSLNYMNEHSEDFSDINGIFDNNLFNLYRLNHLNEAKDTVNYEITFYLDKNNGEWVLKNPDKETLEKINGFYNYTEN